jgi:hypothetical protein
VRAGLLASYCHALSHKPCQIEQIRRAAMLKDRVRSGKPSTTVPAQW